jgi:hypothetical protein
MSLPLPLRTIGGPLGCMIAFACIFVTLGILFMFLMCFVFYSPLAVAWFSNGYWWIFIFTPFAFLFATIAGVCFVRSQEQENTKKRLVNLTMALKQAEDRFLSGTGIQLVAGDYGSWIEVNYYNYISAGPPQIQEVMPYDDYESRDREIKNQKFENERMFKE